MPTYEDRQRAEALLTEITGQLNERYSLHGEPTSDAWGAATWVKLKDEAGHDRFLRIQVMPFK